MKKYREEQERLKVEAEKNRKLQKRREETRREVEEYAT